MFVHVTSWSYVLPLVSTGVIRSSYTLASGERTDVVLQKKKISYPITRLVSRNENSSVANATILLSNVRVHSRTVLLSVGMQDRQKRRTRAGLVHVSRVIPREC